jgi:group I intron endonuclease
MTKCGVYKIINRANNKFYVGSSKNIEERFGHHVWELKKGGHHCHPLQFACNKYGLENLELEIIAETSEEERYAVEQQYLDAHCGKDYCYNLSAAATGIDSAALARRNREYFSNPDNKTKHSEALRRAWADPSNPMRSKLEASNARPEHKEKISAKTKAMWSDPEIRASISNHAVVNATKQWQNDRQKMITALNAPDVIAKQSLLGRERWQDPDYRQKMANRPPPDGEKISAGLVHMWSDPKKREEAVLNSPIRREIKCNETGVIYPSIAQAAKASKVCVKSIKKATLPGRTCKNQTFSYVEDLV